MIVWIRVCDTTRRLSRTVVATTNGDCVSKESAESKATASSHAVRHDLGRAGLERRETFMSDAPERSTMAERGSVLPLGINIGIGLPGL